MEAARISRVIAHHPGQPDKADGRAGELGDGDIGSLQRELGEIIAQSCVLCSKVCTCTCTLPPSAVCPTPLAIHIRPYGSVAVGQACQVIRYHLPGTPGCLTVAGVYRDTPTSTYHTASQTDGSVPLLSLSCTVRKTGVKEWPAYHSI